MKVYVIGGQAQYEAMFERQPGFEVAGSPGEADAIQFTGGEDVTPKYYKEFKHPRTYCNPRRDEVESIIYKEFVGQKILLGICRGSQFLNVMNGGTLYQDVDGHAIGTTHPCFSELLGRNVEVTSTHHQMMRPAPSAELEGYAWKLAKRKEYMQDATTIAAHLDDPKDVEVVFYEDTQTLCFQPHPEFPGAHSTRDYYFTLINHYFH